MSKRKERIEIIGNHSINWDADKETVLKEIVVILNDLFIGTSYTASRNSTSGEKNVDIFYGKGSVDNPRVAHVWPKTRTESVDLCVTIELVEQIKNRVELPEDSDIKPGKYLNWRAFKKIPVSKALEILKELASCVGN